LLAVVERALEHRGLAAPPAAAPSATPAAPAPPAARGILVALVALVVLVVLVLVRLGLGGRRLGLPLDLRRDQPVVLRPEIDLVIEVRARRTVDGFTLRRQVVFALEGIDLLHGHLELVGDPCVGPTLAHPGTDLVQVRAKRAAGHRAARL